METGHPSTRAVNSGSGNRAIDMLGYAKKILLPNCHFANIHIAFKYFQLNFLVFPFDLEWPWTDIQGHEDSVYEFLFGKLLL